MELAGANKAPHSGVINQHKGIPLFLAFEWSWQHPIKVDDNFRLTTRLLDLSHVR
jgi:hypothetical protein